MLELQRPQDDGLYIPDVGPWSAHKHHFLRRYIDAFTTSMKAKKWSGLHYIDLFASAGIERCDGELDWGSPMIAALAPYPFTCLHLCESNRRAYEALLKRVARVRQPNPPQILCGDANVAVNDIVHEIPPRSLSLAFLDPYGLHLHFETLRRLSALRVDLIIFFPDHLDALRNWGIYFERKDSNLDRVLAVEWRDKLLAAPADHRAAVLSGIYERQIRKLGYTEFEHERIALPNGRFLYKLIFCSRDKAGGKIWRGISSRKADGQSTFHWGEPGD